MNRATPYTRRQCATCENMTSGFSTHEQCNDCRDRKHAGEPEQTRAEAREQEKYERRIQAWKERGL